MYGVRSAFLDFIDDPFVVSPTESYRYLEDGLLIVEDGKIKAFGSYDHIRTDYPEIEIIDYSQRLIIPGFVDTHVHYPQTEIIASYGEQLLQWLEKYAFPGEQRFKDPSHAREVAGFFFDELARNGTTTAVVMTTVFPESTRVFFEEAQSRNIRAIAGQVMMDRNAPESLLDNPETAYHNNKDLIKEWHHRGRLCYTITPRFAITSTPEQLEVAGQLKREFPDVYVHTHLSENQEELVTVSQLFPDCKDYLEVYEKAGLVGDRSIFAHGIYLSNSEFKRLSEAGSAIAFCPTSNMFIGSGLFNLKEAKSPAHPIAVGLASDVGAGTSFSMLKTMSAAYKVTQLQKQTLSPLPAFYLATLGGAKAIHLDSYIGNFQIGKESDFIVLNWQATPLMAFRHPQHSIESVEKLNEILFSLMILGDDRSIDATYIGGNLAYRKPDYMTW
ncbi:guanine deaminase [Arthrospira sp. O9.13F]|nr:guanine deaminase [Arthrospira sp. O9.13F]